MSNLVEQFRAMRKGHKTAADTEALAVLTLEDLSTQKVMLGESKKGSTFEQAFQDAQWTEFTLNRFEKSTKPEHYMGCVELKLKEMSRSTTTSLKKVPETSRAEAVPFAAWEELQSMDGELIMVAPILKEEMDGLRQTNQNLSNRMSQVETVMSECPQALRGEERELSRWSLPESEDFRHKVFA